MRRPELTPEMILAVEPYMNELLNLREEVARLRAAVKPAPPGLADVFTAAGLKFGKREGDPNDPRTAGRVEWWCSIKLKDCNTGGIGRTEYDLAVNVLSRFKEMTFADDDDDDE